MEGNRTMRELAAQTPLGYDKPIRLLSGPLPPHPPFGGEVTVRFAVDAQGNVVRPQLLRATAASTLDVSPALLGNATVRALAQWRFTPPVRGGEPTELCCIRLTID